MRSVLGFPCASSRWRTVDGARAILALVALVVTGGSSATAAGTAYGVDTAEVGDPGNCKVEAWVSRAANHDWLATVNPACVINAFTPTELSMQVTRSRADGETSTSLSPKIKAKLVPTAIGRFGFAAAAGVSYDTTSDELTTVYAYIPATLRLSEIVRINVSGGWQLDNTTDRHFATYGLGFDWKLTDTITFTAETFGIIGNGETGSETQPRYQAGLRYRPIDQFSIDLIYGHNINGENSDWVTLGTTVRFPVQ